MSISLNDIINYGTCKFKVVKPATTEDIRNIQNQLNSKMDLTNDWCYIYPNAGTEQNPKSISYNSRYLLTNPFPGYWVHCIPELKLGNQWGTTIFVDADDSYSRGIVALQHGDETIMLTTGSYSNIIPTSTSNWIAAQAVSWTTNVTIPSNTYNLLCRIKVFKLGKIE